MEHLYGVALIPQVLAGLFVELRLGLRNDQRGLPGNALQDRVGAERPGLLGAAGPVHRQIAVEPGLEGDAYHLLVQLSQDDAGMLADIGHKVQHPFAINA